RSSNSTQGWSAHQHRWPCGHTQARFNSWKSCVNAGLSWSVSRLAPCKCRTAKRGRVGPGGSYTSTGLPAISRRDQLPLMRLTYGLPLGSELPWFTLLAAGRLQDVTLDGCSGVRSPLASPRQLTTGFERHRHGQLLTQPYDGPAGTVPEKAFH